LSGIISDITTFPTLQSGPGVRGPTHTKVFAVAGETDGAWVFIVPASGKGFGEQGADITAHGRGTGGRNEAAESVAGVATEGLEIAQAFAVVPVALGQDGRVVGVCGHVAGEGCSVIDGVVMSVEFKGVAGGVVVVFSFVEDVEGGKGIPGGELKGGSGVGAHEAREKGRSEAHGEKPGKTLEVLHVEENSWSVCLTIGRRSFDRGGGGFCKGLGRRSRLVG